MMKIKRKWKWISSFIVLILIILILFLIFGQSKILISYQTTRITEPVDENGYVDYLKHLNQQASEGVTPENNFEYALMKISTLDFINNEYRKEYLNRIGLQEEDAADEESSFQEPYEFLTIKLKEDKENYPNELAADNRADEIMSMIEQPWSDKDFPLVTQWLKANTDKLDLISEATKRPRCYIPYFNTVEPENALCSLLLVLYPSVFERRHIARGFSARAMHRIYENNLEGAQSDLLAIHRLARLVINDSVFTMELLIGITVENMAYNADLVMLEKANMNKDQIMNYLDTLNMFQRKSNIARLLDNSERFSFLDVMQSMTKSSSQENNFGKRLLVKISLNRMNFNSIMEWGNEEYDKMVAFAELNDPVEIIKQAKTQSDKIEALIKKTKPNLTSQLFEILGAGSGHMLGTDPSKYSYFELVCPNVALFVDAEYSSIFKTDATKIAFALKAYQLDHKKYPEKLEELKPDYLSEIPLDLFTGKLPFYQITEKGFLIYSIGVNQKDEKGYGPRGLINENITGDDITVEFPVNPDKFK